MKAESRNFVIFAATAALILLAWSLISPRLFPAAPPVTRVVNGKTQPLPNPRADPVASTAVHARPLATVLADSPRLRVETPELSGSIALKGARVDDLVLNRYKQDLSRNAAPTRLLSPSGAPDAYFAQFGWSGDGLSAPSTDTVWTADAATLTPQRPVTLRWTSPTGQRFALRVAVDEHFMFTVTQSVGNTGATPITAGPYALLSRAGESKDVGSWSNHIGPIGVFNNAAKYSIDYGNLAGKPPSFFWRLFGDDTQGGANYFDTTGGWLGFGDKYWLTALIPDQRVGVHSGFRSSGPDQFQADVALAPRPLRPGQVLTTTTRLFAGAKEVNLLDSYETGGVSLFGKAVDWGWFAFIEKPIFTYLDWLFRHVGNFGVAIVLLTLTIKALLFPIANKQFASMASMRAVQPKMKALQERYKDDKPRQQQEVMALYKQEKVNPVAGCLPAFLQIPIFYALYKVLLTSIEMRHQPFVLWIKDLSAPDPLTPVNLFGLLPFDPPGLLHLGVLAILLGVTMWLQMRMNPAAGDPAQQQVMAIMPWMMMLFFAPLAAGLQLYYVANNLLTLVQQRVLYARHPQLKAAAA